MNIAPHFGREAPAADLIAQVRIALEAKQYEAAAALADQATQTDPSDPTAWSLLSVALLRLGHPDAAVTAAQQATMLPGAGADHYTKLGTMLRAAKQVRAAERAFRQALAHDETHIPAHSNLGNLYLDNGRFKEAEDCYRGALAVEPDSRSAWRGLGLVYQRSGKISEAYDAFLKATPAPPYDVAVMSDLAICMHAMGETDRAIHTLLQAMAIDPQHAAAAGNLGALYLKDGRITAARHAAVTAHELDPKDSRWILNLGATALQCGDLDEAIAHFRRALALQPDSSMAGKNLLFCMNYHPDLPAEEIAAEYQRWEEAHACRYIPEAPTFDNDPDCERRLRIGYLSPDFRAHSVHFFLEPLLQSHDRSKVEIFCYAEVPKPDQVTKRFMAVADHWRSTVGLLDEQVAAMIRDDRIDILIDCGGHTASSRLLVLAHKPAPVQVSYLLGHGYTSGLSTVDAFFADERLAPSGSDHLFAEPVIRLPRVPFAYAPPAGLPPVAPLPALTSGRVSFGYFGRLERVNYRVVASWSEILKRVPGSRLILNTKSLRDEETCALFRARFAEHGIGPEQLCLVYTTPQPKTWAAYGDIDIALDPFPHNAGTTSCEAIWLGVPVLTLAGRPSVGRFGASIAGALGLDDWVTHNVDDYVAKAVAAAQDLDALAALRAGLRQRFQASPLADAQDLARHIETAYRQLWTDWVQRQQQPIAEAVAGAL